MHEPVDEAPCMVVKPCELHDVLDHVEYPNHSGAYRTERSLDELRVV